MSDEGTRGGYEKLIGRDVKSGDGYGSGPILARSGQWGEWQTPCAPPGRRMGMVQGVEMWPYISISRSPGLFVDRIESRIGSSPVGI